MYSIKNNLLKLPKNPISLKRTLIGVLVIGTLIPLVLIGIVTYHSLYLVQRNRIAEGIGQNLRNVITGMENIFGILDYTSREMAYNGKVSRNLEKYLETDDIAVKYELGKDIKEYVSLVCNTNSGLGVVFYYFPDTHEKLFNNFQIDDNFSYESLPLFMKYKSLAFYGPHRTAGRLPENDAFAVLRKLDIYSKECYIYVEMNFKHFTELMNNKQYGFKVSHILLNSAGEIVYSQLTEDFPVGKVIDSDNKQKGFNTINKYYVFEETSNQGWKLMAAIDRKAYNMAVYEWTAGFVIIIAISLIISLLLAFAIWEAVYRPLKYLNKEMALISQNKFDSAIKVTKIKEFDDLLHYFQHMKLKITDLFTEIERKEKLKSQIEVEKLLHQINPHFLYNTLNIIQWFARMEGHEKIDRLVDLFTKVLHYNLGKEGGIVKISEEIAALKDYVELQRMKFDYQLDIKINADERVLDALVPRFILQPLVENAIYHGLKDDSGYIRVDIGYDEESVFISVKDNGQGLNETEIRHLLNDNAAEGKKVRLGIGLSYVNRILAVYYGSEVHLNVDSTPGEGTTFTIKIPYNE